MCIRRWKFIVLNC